MQLDLATVPELQSRAASKGEVHYLAEGDEVHRQSMDHDLSALLLVPGRRLVAAGSENR